MSQLSRVKIGKRLTAIEAMVSHEYDHIWDCCCDHGLLGFQLLENAKAPHIHFVDIVVPLLSEIKSKLNRYYQGDDHYYVHCLDVAELPLAQYSDQKHLIIIAGVGGELLVEFLRSLFPLTKALNVEFILVPVHHNYQLRLFLNKNNCALIDESIITENNRFYELLHIKHGVGLEVSLAGDTMWDFNNVDHQNYLQQTIKHYQRIAKNPQINVSEIIYAYQQLIRL